MQHPKQVRTEFAQRRVLEFRQFPVPQSLPVYETVEVLIAKCRRHQEEPLVYDFLRELADQVVAAAGSHPQQVCALGGRGVDKQLDLAIGEYSEPLHNFACETT